MNPNLPDDIYTGEGARLRLALCQVKTKAWDVAGNVQRTMDALEEAAAQGAQLAVTPECVFHSYGFGENREDTRKRQLEIAEPFGWMGWEYRRPEAYERHLSRETT
jgi:hypothetical protein